MAILIKVHPQELGSDAASFSLPRTRQDIAERGERAFIWFAEKLGGCGLVGNGIIETIEPNADGTVRISLGKLETADVGFGNAQLRSFRDLSDTGPESTLAKKIYNFSHVRAVRLSAEEDTFLSGLLG